MPIFVISCTAFNTWIHFPINLIPLICGLLQYVTLLSWLLIIYHTYRLISTQLHGNVCGDYGLRMIHANRSSGPSGDLCYQGHLTSISNLQFGDVVTIKFWYQAGAGSFEFVSYFWATQSGELPTWPSFARVSNQIQVDLVSTSQLETI